MNLVRIPASWCSWGLANVGTESVDQGRFSESILRRSVFTLPLNNYHFAWQPCVTAIDTETLQHVESIFLVERQEVDYDGLSGQLRMQIQNG